MVNTLFDDPVIAKDNSCVRLGSGLTIRVCEAFPQQAELYRHKELIKKVDLSDKVAMRLFVVETVELGSEKLALAKALGITRQTVYNYLEIQKRYGREGLVHGYSTKNSSLREERRKHSSKRDLGNKAKQVALIRNRATKDQEEKEAKRQPQLNYSFGDSSVESMADSSSTFDADVKENTASNTESLDIIGDLSVRSEEKISHVPSTSGSSEGSAPCAKEVLKEALDFADADESLPSDLDSAIDASRESTRPGSELFAEEYDWQATRYAGVFCYVICLQSVWNWLQLVLDRFGKSCPIFLVFLLMAAKNIRSIESLKHVRLREAGLLLGLGKLPSRTRIWQWFYDAARQRVSSSLLFDYFCYQIREGLVSLYSWFTDGHLLPYTGKEKVHQAFNTQRQMPEPGQTNLVTCDLSGRIVDFEIEEGKGNLRRRISTLFQRWLREVPECPVMVFDREGYGGEFFLGLIDQKIPFATWEKHIDKSKLSAIDDGEFTEGFLLNGKEYRVFEGEKSFSVDLAESEVIETKTFSVRRIYIWNLSTNSRTCGLTWSGAKTLSIEDGARLILSRWGASENTFKHLQDRHPLHYHPGFFVSESDNQKIANPEVRAKEKSLARSRKELAKFYKKLSKTKESSNKDGSPRKNCIHRRLKEQIESLESKIIRLTNEKGALPNKVNVESLSDYKSFKKIDNEGKNLFDFVTTSVWNARKEMVDWLRPCFDRESELVDLFYAITNCQGSIRSTKTEVTVRLEPLQQSKRLDAQTQFCRKLTGRNVQLPNSKWLTIEVGELSRAP